jgi:hypothetical protein
MKSVLLYFFLCYEILGVPRLIKHLHPNLVNHGCMCMTVRFPSDANYSISVCLETSHGKKGFCWSLDLDLVAIWRVESNSQITFSS